MNLDDRNEAVEALTQGAYDLLDTLGRRVGESIARLARRSAGRGFRRKSDRPPPASPAARARRQRLGFAISAVVAIF